ncbi:MAG TPA: XRE family transcriptional regulator [Clostridiales bacterium]|nr:XRE family transcriptional regulator [Clostridiales bacterium]HBR09234.1 XRE family transcriptional regulator [Clostridiales bacterium]
MEGGLTRAEVAALIAELAFARADDAVKLAFSPDDGTEGLDLQLVREIKRGGNGAVELKLLDREKLIELLVELLKPTDNEGSQELYSAIDNAAKRLGGKPDAV